MVKRFKQFTNLARCENEKVVSIYRLILGQQANLIDISELRLFLLSKPLALVKAAITVRFGFITMY